MTPRPEHIVQLAPQIAPGSGVAGVAYALEQEFIAAGVRVERFTMTEARGGRPPALYRSRLGHLWDVLWLSTIGTRRARRFLAARPSAVSICHNDVLAGDVYVNHGLLQAAMRARGRYAWRMLRNPLHLFTAARDRIRYRGRTHRAVVALSDAEATALRRTYGRLAAPVTVIPNGVDLDRFRPPTPAERARTHPPANASDGALRVLFVGHEFDRKGLPLVIAALAEVPDARLTVVGGAPAAHREASAHAERCGVGDRVEFAGATDPAPYLQATDVFVLPSAYESSGLVFLEALACGVPVLATAVGVAPERVVDGVNGFLVARDPADIARRLRQLAGADRAAMATAARASVADLGWDRIAARYLDLLGGLAERTERLRIVHAIRSDGFSGVERFVTRLARAQSAAGHEVRVIGGDPARMRPALAGTGIPFAAARTTLEVSRALRSVRGRTDVVNTHMTAAELAAVNAFGARGDRPAVVATRHFARPRRSAGGLRVDWLVSRVLDAELSISDAVADAIEVPSTVVHTGLADRPITDGNGPEARQRIVLVAQRLQPEKRTADAIRIFADSGLAQVGWALQIVGAGPEAPLLLEAAEQAGVAQQTELLGHRDDLQDLMRTAAVLLAPCDVEGLGLTVMEAMQAGLPVIAADAGGHADLLAGLDPRALYRPGDLAAAAAALRSLSGDERGRDSLAAAQAQRQRERFTIGQQLAGTDAVYRAAIARRKGRR